MLSLDGICFAHHGRGPVTDGLELEVPPGEVHLLEGPSGSGKSTILRIAAGLIPRVQGGCIDGQARLDGDPVHRIPPAQLPHRIGWVPQDPEESFTARTVESELTRLAWKVETNDAEQAATRALAELGAQRLLHQETDTLSGGEAALVSLAAAGLAQPDVLVLDEPTAPLDATKTKRVAAWLEEHRRRGACILAAAHPPHPLASMAKKVHTVEPIAAQIRASPSTPRARMAAIATMSDQAEARMAADPEGQRAATMGEDGSAAAPTIPEAEGGGPLARLTSATRDYEGGPLLGGFDLELEPGEVVCLSGPNGSGKTTALHMLCGLIEPDEGQAQLMGEAPSQLSPRELASRVAIAFQHPAWHITQDTLAQEVAFTCEQLDRSVEVTPLLERLGLASYAGEHPWDLSGGERQRMALATASAHEPPVLLLDEPTRGLDPASLTRIAGLLTERVRAGKATLVASHHPWMHELAHRTVRLEAPT